MSGCNKDSSVPQPCVTGCGFNGTPEKLRMCSKCYRAHQEKEKRARQPTPTSVERQPVEKDVKFEESVVQPTSYVKVVKLKDEEQVEVAASSSSSTQKRTVKDGASIETTEAPTATDAVDRKRKIDGEQQPGAAIQEEPKKKVQARRNRCYTCSRKVGLTSFKCRCDFYYCAEHRYAEMHNCRFDYRAQNKTMLERENPTVRAAKVPKI